MNEDEKARRFNEKAAEIKRDREEARGIVPPRTWWCCGVERSINERCSCGEGYYD